jgi:pimeloyl-ACP methyl ester carboxylesterase
VIAYDHRGHGNATVGRDGFTTRALFDDLIAVVEHFDVHDLTIVAHSMGTFARMGALAVPAGSARRHHRRSRSNDTDTAITHDTRCAGPPPERLTSSR